MLCKLVKRNLDRFAGFGIAEVENGGFDFSLFKGENAEKGVLVDLKAVFTC